ncbi:MAG: hypothetical protein NC200_01865 [Candidatus Gastranaerophilales bacterium]|nr:hypothetical protein [Candidatus Gastranaerophilales bacterium]
MKLRKIIILVVFVIIACIPAISAESPAEFKTASGFVRVTTNMLGYNFITRTIAQNVIKKSLNKSVKGSYNVKIDSFSGVDLKKGKFKGLTIEGKNLCLDDEVYFSKLYLQTTSKFNYIDYKNKPVKFKTDIPMVYAVEISEDDLNKTVSGRNNLDTLSSLIPLVKFEKVKFRIYDSRLHINTGVRFPFCKPVKCSISTGLSVQDGKIIFSDIDTGSMKDELAEKLINIMNNYNFLENINLHLFDETDTTMAVKNVKIIDKKIYIDGNVTIKKA